MAQITFKKGDEYMVRLNKLASRVQDDVIGRSVYEGAKIVTDEIAERIPNIKTDESWGTSGSLKQGPKEVEIKAVYRGLGIAPMRNDKGFINVKVGFGGYSDIRTKRWPNGQPIAMLARSIERGTSFMKENPFVKPAVKDAEARAVKAMGEVVDKETEKIMKSIKIT